MFFDAMKRQFAGSTVTTLRCLDGETRGIADSSIFIFLQFLGYLEVVEPECY